MLTDTVKAINSALDSIGLIGKAAVVIAAAVAGWRYFATPITLTIAACKASHSMMKAFGPDAGKVALDMMHALRKDIDEMKMNGFLRDRYLGLGIYVCRPDGATTYVSQNLCTMFQTTEEQMLGFSWVSKIEDGMALASRWRMCAENGLNWDERYWVHLHGERHEVVTQAFPVKTKDGHIMSYVGMCRFSGKVEKI